MTWMLTVAVWSMFWTGFTVWTSSNLRVERRARQRRAATEAEAKR
jgi:hypothetical protein